MIYCSNCGHELSGAKKFCSNCGYRISDEEIELASESKSTVKKPTSDVKFKELGDINKDLIEEEEPREAEILAKPSYTSRPVPPGTKVKEKIPKSTRCSVCGVTTNDICFFCDWAVCNHHDIKMQIVTDTGKFGNIITSCPDCAKRKNGRQPTQEEAAEVGFFFKIKPYHEWKIQQ